MVGHDVGVPASFQYEDFLLKGGDIIICEEGGRERQLDGESYEGGDPSVPGGEGGDVGKEPRVSSSPGSIFTIFSATRSPVALSRALQRGSRQSGRLHLPESLLSIPESRSRTGTPSCSLLPTEASP